MVFIAMVFTLFHVPETWSVVRMWERITKWKIGMGCYDENRHEFHVVESHDWSGSLEISYV